MVGIPILFTDKTFVLDFTSIATLFAFVLVCGGVLLLPRVEKRKGRFSMPYINGKLIFPSIVIFAFIGFSWANNEYFIQTINFNFNGNSEYIKGLVSFMDLATPKISVILFWLICSVLSIFTFIKKYSLIPLMGVSTCLYLLTGMSKSNWAWFITWMVLGLIFYFIYSYKHSKLNDKRKVI